VDVWQFQFSREREKASIGPSFRFGDWKRGTGKHWTITHQTTVNSRRLWKDITAVCPVIYWVINRYMAASRNVVQVNLSQITWCTLDFNMATMPPETVFISAPELLIYRAFAPSPLIHAQHCYCNYVLLRSPHFKVPCFPVTRIQHPLFGRSYTVAVESLFHWPTLASGAIFIWHCCGIWLFLLTAVDTVYLTVLNNHSTAKQKIYIRR